MVQCIAAVLGSLAAPTAVDYNEAQDKPQEIKEEDTILRKALILNVRSYRRLSVFS